MNEDLRKELEAAGVDVAETLHRFMNNEGLMVKFLKKFNDDETMDKLRSIIAEKNFAEVYTAAHTLKGVCGNLGLTRLYEIFSEMSEDSRNEKFDNVEALFSQAETEYASVISVIKKM